MFNLQRWELVLQHLLLQILKAGATYILTLAQTGAVTVDWNSLVKWPAATAPTLSGNLKTDVITLICYDATGSGLYYGNATLDFTT